LQFYNSKMSTIFRNDIFSQENSFFLKNTYLLPRYINEQKHLIDSKEIKNIIQDVHEASTVQQHLGMVSLPESLVTESLMKRCFSKCKQFVLEDWVDFDELDCTMKCTLLHKKSMNIMKEINKNI
jgi:hypothetical protein